MIPSDKPDFEQILQARLEERELDIRNHAGEWLAERVDLHTTIYDVVDGHLIERGEAVAKTAKELLDRYTEDSAWDSDYRCRQYLTVRDDFNSELFRQLCYAAGEAPEQWQGEQTEWFDFVSDFVTWGWMENDCGRSLADDWAEDWFDDLKWIKQRRTTGDEIAE